MARIPPTVVRKPPRRGLVGIIANDFARASEFTASVMRLDIPDGWQKEMLIGGDWCSARNELAQQTVDDGFSHLWFMDDDHSFAPDLLRRLLAWDVPIVNPMCLTRTYPFQPVTYVEEGALDLASVPPEGLVELHAAGAAGMLIHRSVLEAVPPPWFEYSDRSEDIIFCEKARAAGFKLYGDLGARLGHITTAVVWPSYTPEHGWMTGINVGKDLRITVPLTADLVNHDIRRIDVPMASEEEPAAAGAPVGGEDGVEGRPESSSEQFERAELWFDEDEQRYHARLLDAAGAIVYGVGPWTHEQDALARLEQLSPGVSVFFIKDHLDDSRRKRTGPPLRLWDFTPTKGHLS